VSEVRVVAVEGDVDMQSAPALREELRRAVSNEDAGLVADLSTTTYLDSAGVNVLFELAEELNDRQLGFAVVIPEGSLVERVVTLVDLASAAAVHRTVEDARRALEP
jgi:anti-anti-sigma factor